MTPHRKQAGLQLSARASRQKAKKGREAERQVATSGERRPVVVGYLKGRNLKTDSRMELKKRGEKAKTALWKSLGKKILWQVNGPAAKGEILRQRRGGKVP